MAYQQTFGSPEGQMVVADLLRRFGYARQPTVPPHSGAPIDPYRALYCEGQRSVLVHVGLMLDSDPLQVKEAYDRVGED